MTENELILTSVLNCRRVDLYTNAQELTPLQLQQIEIIKQRRQNGEPLQYILGQCEFMGLTFKVDERVLIPRPETEILVETALSILKSLPQKEFTVLDIGTGSGNIAIALAKLVSNVRVTAVDFSQPALDLALLNAKMNAVENKIQFIQSDLFTALKKDFSQTKFDLIVSNPPYIATRGLSSLPMEVQKEPRAALDGGIDGLEFYRRILQEANNFLKTKGCLILEIGESQKQSLECLLQNFLLKKIEFLKDLSGRDRILLVEFNSIPERRT